jgi:hypothetical protein
MLLLAAVRPSDPVARITQKALAMSVGCRQNRFTRRIQAGRPFGVAFAFVAASPPYGLLGGEIICPARGDENPFILNPGMFRSRAGLSLPSIWLLH